jgi:hypothetical protein
MAGLIRGVARTAAIAGTASAVSGRVHRRQAEKFASRDAAIIAQRQAAYDDATAGVAASAPPPATPASDTADDKVTRLKQLAELRDQGILTDDEFTAEKRKILDG